MVRAENLSFGFADKELYHNISFCLESGKHCALIGGNGTGKTTLTDMICNPSAYIYDGKLTITGLGRVGRVNQFAPREDDQNRTVMDELRRDFIKLEEDTAKVCAQMEDADDFDGLLLRYQELLDEAESMDAEHSEVNIHRQLHLADLEDKAELPLRLLSGGEYKLVQIVRQMLRRPGLLIMDEPDVFLDFENLNGLRDLINGYEGTLLVITHNRYLLGHCFNQIWHLENTDLQEFDGNFTEYRLSLLRRKIELQEQEGKEAAEIQRVTEMVDRLREETTEVIDPNKGRTLKGKVTYLERLKSRQIKAPFVEIRRPNIRLPESNEDVTDEPLLVVNDLSLVFQKPLMEHIHFAVHDGEKVAIVGPNGTGKTSLLRLIKQNSTPGIQFASRARVGWFSQLQETLPAEGSIYDMFDIPQFKNHDEIAEYLQGYGFDSDFLHRSVNKLSGGERNLLQLARLGVEDCNLLLLDEPSSHLDTYAQVALEQALKTYKGAVLMASHDFYSIANCADTILYIDDGTLRSMSPRAFRKMVYKHHFRQEYLELENKKQLLEMEIDSCLEHGQTEWAKARLAELANVVEKLSN